MSVLVERDDGRERRPEFLFAVFRLVKVAHIVRDDQAIARFDDVVTVWLSGLMEFDDNGVLASAQRGDLSVFAIGNGSNML